MKIEYISDASGKKNGLIRFYDFTGGERQALVQNLRDLITGKQASVRIHELPGVKALAGLELTAMVGDRQKEIVPLSGKRFNWIVRPIDWQDIIEKIEILPESSKGHYQWLTDYSGIEVVFSQDGTW
jgi:hypothetical protein